MKPSFLCRSTQYSHRRHKAVTPPPYAGRVKLPQTRALGTPVHWVTETPSTNLTLRDMWQEDSALPSGTIVITDRQVAGRGRQGRGWETPPGKALAVSVILRDVPAQYVTWLPLIVATAAMRAFEPLFTRENEQRRWLGVKWPNDVHALTPGGALAGKLAGILCELLPDGSVIAGIGMNLFQNTEELPTDRAGSLLTEGAELGNARSLHSPEGEVLADNLLTTFIASLFDLCDRLHAEPEGVIGNLHDDSATLRRTIRVILPGGNERFGTAAEALDASGALILIDTEGERHTIHSGDVEHVREWVPGLEPGGGE